MLTADQIDVLGEKARQLVSPVTEFLIEDIAKRITQAGQLTSTAAYQAWRLQQLGVSQRQLKKELRKRLKVSHRELRRLLNQAGEAGYEYDVRKHPYVQAVPFRENQALQQIVSAAAELADENLSNITQTLGFVGPDGKARELTKAYQNACDFAFQKVATGAQDYASAIREATRNLADRGIVSIDYESGVSTSLEAAVRRNVMGGIGLMQEKISQQNHDDFGCDGWEISAHAASAPDHEPIQGKQYSDEAYEKLNNSLVRRIGTLNCGHAAFPIILGVDTPQYTPEELAKLRQDNETGIDYNGKHYSMYETTQRQRRLEASIRKQKRRILIAEATEDKEGLQQNQIKYQVLNQEYKRFSKAAGLRLQHERMEMPGFGSKQAREAEKVFKNSFTSSETQSIINTQGGELVTISSIESPIEQRSSGKGNPNAILTFGVSLNNRQDELLQQLPDLDSRVVVPKNKVKMSDLSALTAKTGVEFAMFTREGARLVIRGSSVNVNVTEEMAVRLQEEGYRWSGHTHPGYDSLCLMPSDGDKLILKCFKQIHSSIYNSKGQNIVFDEEGVI